MRRAKYLLIGLLFLLPVIGWLGVAHAQSFHSGDNVTVAADETVNDTLYATGKTIDIAGTVNGDVFCFGQDITVSATVHGDVICAGQSVSVTGKVSGDVRLAGQDVTLGGTVDGNASVAGQTFTESSHARVGRDISIGSQTATLNGPVGRDLAASARNVTVNNSVGRNVQANVRKLSLGSNASIGGSVDYTSNDGLARSKGAVVAGSITRSSPKAGHVRPGAIVAVNFFMALFVFVAFLLIALLLVLFMPRTFHMAAETARGHLLRTFLVGFVASIVVPVVLVALLFTVVGIPLALFAGLVWLVMVLLSGSFAAYLLGRLLLQGSTNNAIWIMLLGGAVLLILYFVPFLGVITSLLALWFGLGTILQQFAHMPRPRYDMAVANTKR